MEGAAIMLSFTPGNRIEKELRKTQGQLAEAYHITVSLMPDERDYLPHNNQE